MAIDYNKGQLPKAPSNSTNMGAMPGTQQTAIQNVNTGANINPSMPSAPQLAKQSKSSFQQGLMKTPAPKMPAASAPPKTPIPRDRMVAQGQAMDPGRGYNIFSGMGAGDISQMNQSMGLSNMSNLPSPDPGAVRAATLGEPGRQTNRFLMSGEGSGSYPETVNVNGQTMVYDESTGLYYGTGNASGVAYDPESGEMVVQWTASGPATKYQVGKVIDKIEEEEEEEGLGYEKVDPDKVTADALAGAESETIGIDEEQKQELFDNLDQEYSLKLEQVLAGLDRQAAMMGTFGSGAHIANVNNAVAQALANMADEYNEINKLDVQVTETDFQQLFSNQLAVAGLSEQQATNAFNMLSQVDQNLVTSMGDYITTYAPNEDVAAELTGLLGDTVADGYSKVESGEWTMSEYTAKLKINFSVAQAAIMAANGESPEKVKGFLDQRFGDIINPFADDLPAAQEYLKNTLGMILGGPVVGAAFGFNMAKDLVEDVGGWIVDTWNDLFG